MSWQSVIVIPQSFIISLPPTSWSIMVSAIVSELFHILLSFYILSSHLLSNALKICLSRMLCRPFPHCATICSAATFTYTITLITCCACALVSFPDVMTRTIIKFIVLGVAIYNMQKPWAILSIARLLLLTNGAFQCKVFFRQESLNCSRHCIISTGSSLTTCQ